MLHFFSFCSRDLLDRRLKLSKLVAFFLLKAFPFAHGNKSPELNVLTNTVNLNYTEMWEVKCVCIHASHSASLDVNINDRNDGKSLAASQSRFLITSGAWKTDDDQRVQQETVFWTWSSEKNQSSFKYNFSELGK